MKKIYLARQPIVSADEQLYAYEIMYIDSNKESGTQKGRFASAAVLSSILNTFGAGDLLGGYRGFIKVDEKFLMGDLIKTLPKEHFVLSIFDEIPMNERVRERIEQLSDLGFSLAINDSVLTHENLKKYARVMERISYFKVNASLEVEVEQRECLAVLHSHNIKVIGVKIENLEQYALSKKIGFDLYQGYWFARPELIEGKTFNPAHLDVLRLYNLLIQDTSIDEITKEFERNHALTIQLLKYINSANFHFRQPISSIHHVLTLVGRKPLSQWLMLIIYSKSVEKSNVVSPLMLMVKNRTELMQNLLKALKPDVKENALGEAYLVGVVSLMGAVFKVPLEEILNKLQLSDITRNALLYDKGTLGILYKTVRDIEEFNVNELVAFCKKYSLSEEILQEVILQGMDNVNQFEKSFE